MDHWISADVRSLLEKTLDQTGDPLLWVDEEGQVLLANRSACEFLSHTRNSLSDASWFEVVPAFTRDAWQAFWNSPEPCEVTGIQVVCVSGAGRSLSAIMKLKTCQSALGRVCIVSLEDPIFREKNREESAERDNRLRSIIAEAPFGAHSYRLDSDGRLVFLGANHAADRILGIDHTALIGKTIEEVFPGLVASTIPEDYRRVAKCGLGFSTDQVNYENGEIRGAFEIHVFQPRQDHVTVFFLDITERKKIETALEESQNLFKTFSRSAQAVIFIIDKEGIFQLSEGKGLEHLGLSSGEVVGQSAFELYRDHPDVVESIRSALAGNSTRVINSFPQGTFDSIYSPYYSVDGEPIGVVGISIDITGQVRAEKALSQASFALDHVADCVYWFDKDMILIEVNAAACAMLGYTHDELLSLDFSRVDPNFRSSVSKDAWENLKRAGTALFETFHYTRDGRKIPVEVSANYIHFQGQDYNCALARDITIRREAQEKAHRINEELEQRVSERTAQLQDANRELEAFAYSVSHDLRSPLRAIDGYTQILTEDYSGLLDEEGKRVCAVIRRETRRMGRLIDDLLAFSRLNRTEMQFRPVDMTSLVRAVYEDLAVNMDKQRIQFSSTPLGEVIGDESMLRQVITNLLSNAIKFTRHRSEARIEVSMEMENGENIYHVHDNGAGFDMRYVEKLFGVFQRLHSEKEFEGTGVGLAIVQRIIHRHNGHVWAESVLDQGTTVSFTLQRGEVGDDQ